MAVTPVELRHTPWHSNSSNTSDRSARTKIQTDRDRVEDLGRWISQLVKFRDRREENLSKCAQALASTSTPIDGSDENVEMMRFTEYILLRGLMEFGWELLDSHAEGHAGSILAHCGLGVNGRS